MSDHTRITGLPLRLSVTRSNQLLFGSVGLKGCEPPAELPPALPKKVTKPAQVPACARVERTPIQRVSKSKAYEEDVEGNKEDEHLRRIPALKAGVRQLKSISIHVLSLGAGHCIAVGDTGIAYTWGSGRRGQLGDGEQEDNVVPRPVQGIRQQVKGASAGMVHSAFVTTGGAVFTCGDGSDGRLGHGDDSIQLVPTQIMSLPDSVRMVAVQAGGAHTLLLSSHGEVYACGCGMQGRLGVGSMDSIKIPVIVAALEHHNVVGIAAGAAHSVAVTDQGETFTWGIGVGGRLGHGTGTHEFLPRQVILSSHATVGAVAVAAGECHTCILRSDGSLITFGRVSHGRSAEGVVHRWPFVCVELSI